MPTTKMIIEKKQDISVLFSDICEFTAFASTCSAEFVVQFLNRHFVTFDSLCAKHNLEKVKTIGYLLFAQINNIVMLIFALDHLPIIRLTLFTWLLICSSLYSS